MEEEAKKRAEKINFLLIVEHHISCIFSFGASFVTQLQMASSVEVISHILKNPTTVVPHRDIAISHYYSTRTMASAAL